MFNVLETLTSAGFSAYLCGYGAIDSWLGRGGGSVRLLTNADTAELAKLFEDLRYPGIDLADAALDGKDQTWYFHCADSIAAFRPSCKLLQFYQDCRSRTFHDPCGVYPLLAEIRRSIHTETQININPLEIFREGNSLMDAALILAKYFPVDSLTDRHIREVAQLFPDCAVPAQEEQRLLLSELMLSPNPGLGLELLKASGFIGKFWHELANLDQADHSKEFHPEGNAWKHTMETFRYRKTGAPNATKLPAHDLRLSLGLLLHDIGKPIAISAGSRRYDGHAELGESQARRFLGRLGFSTSVSNDVCFLVRNHMLPAALPRLPLYRTAEIMASPLFPVLLELYRCDESSSFKGLDGYYESSAAYQSFLRNRRNPYRSADGKKLKQMSGAGVR
ncbi:MAG: HD domain-containing protein [Treponema sp.]|jgi:poly(A) polymerase|nr:HD domain-containing protein [Treponema sp.]